MSDAPLAALIAEQERWAASVAAAKKRRLYDDDAERAYEQGYLDGLTEAVRIMSRRMIPAPELGS